MVLLRKNDANDNLIPVIQAAIIGSILANLLLCLGFCFFVGGMRREKQVFEQVISEVGSGILLVAGFGLSIPCAFSLSVGDTLGNIELESLILKISRSTAVILLAAFLM